MSLYLKDVVALTTVH